MTTKEIKDLFLPDEVIRHFKNEGAQAERKALKARTDRLEDTGEITSQTAAHMRSLLQRRVEELQKRKGGLGRK